MWLHLSLLLSMGPLRGEQYMAVASTSCERIDQKEMVRGQGPKDGSGGTWNWSKNASKIVELVIQFDG